MLQSKIFHFVITTVLLVLIGTAIVGTALLGTKGEYAVTGNMPEGTTQSTYKNATLQVIANQPSVVFDLAHRLVWSRCLVGQKFEDGRCMGKAKELTYDQAHAAARKINSEFDPQEHWQLPTAFQAATLLHCPGNAYYEGPNFGLECCPSKLWSMEFHRCEIPDETGENKPWLRLDIFPASANTWTSEINDIDNNGSGGLTYSYDPTSQDAYGRRLEYRAQMAPVRLVRSLTIYDQNYHSEELKGDFPVMPF